MLQGLQVRGVGLLHVAVKTVLHLYRLHRLLKKGFFQVGPGFSLDI